MPKHAPAESPRCLDLFSGIGGLTLGFARAGIRSVGGIDHWADARATFERNLGPVRCAAADLAGVELRELESALSFDRRDVDIVAGGPPCQGFSTVGKRDRADPRNELWTCFRGLVAAIRPAYVVLENVEGLMVMDKGTVAEAIVAGFQEIGYRMKRRLLRSADYGVPQLRKRMVFLGWLAGCVEPAFPSPSDEPWVTVGEAIFDLPPVASGEVAERYTAKPVTAYQRARRGATNALTHHEAARHPARLVEMLRHIPDGGNRTAIPDELQPRSGFHNSYARLASGKPAVAVTSNLRKPSSARATHPLQHRGLTVREGLRLQGFDDDFTLCGIRTSQYVQVGNAVPPPLAEAIGREVARAWAATGMRRLREARARAAEPAYSEGGLLADRS